MGETAADSPGPCSARFDDLVSDHAATVHRLARRLTENRADAEDLTQEVFLRAFRAIDRVDPVNPAGWLHRITVNTHLDHLRRQARGPSGPAVELAGEGEGVRCEAPGPEQVVVGRGLAADLEEALAQLSPQTRRAVLLRDVEGLSYREVAARLGVGTDTVRSWIHRGRRRLRAALSHRAGILSG